MIKVENIDVYGFGHAIRGMRNPMNSWGKSDSEFGIEVEEDTYNQNYITNVINDIGPNDLKLMQSLVKAGTDHSKFMRMINVTMDITAPLYWISEHDTYKVGTVRNSCSFMHKGVSKPFEISDFSINDNSQQLLVEYVIPTLNRLRDVYIETKDDKIFESIRQILPSGYNQRYTWQANYQVCRNIYKSRKNHKLPHWLLLLLHRQILRISQQTLLLDHLLSGL